MVVKPGRFPSAKNRLKKIVKDPFNHLHLAEAIAERLQDRVKWWKSRLNKDGSVKIQTAALDELSFVLPILLEQMKEWREELWPEAVGGLLSKHSYEVQLNYKKLYEAEREKNNKALKLALKLNSTMTNESILEEIKNLDRDHLEHYYSKHRSSQH